jgi:predicted outer membrane repeat protein
MMVKLRQMLALTFLLTAVLAALGMWAAPAASAPASVVGDGTPGSCTDQAWMEAVQAGGAITFKCGTAPHTIEVSTAVIEEVVSVDGEGLITLSGQGTLQHFYVLTSGSLTLRNITLTKGDQIQGGAILNTGSAELDNVHLVENSSSGGSGGAIYSSGTLTITNSEISDNMATFYGGAIVNNGGQIEISATSFVNNRAGQGGAIYHQAGTAVINSALFMGNGYASTSEGGAVFASAPLEVTNSTFAGNFAETGGGIYNDYTAVNVLNSTFHINRADLGGALFNLFGTTRMKNTILSTSLSLDGTTSSLNCDGPPHVSDGYNLGSDQSCSLTQTGDLQNTDPMLAPLGDNGGPTLTHMPMPNSPAIDGGTNEGCPADDQRGYPRPAGSACDIGAVEAGAEPAALERLFLPVVVR